MYIYIYIYIYVYTHIYIYIRSGQPRSSTGQVGSHAVGTFLPSSEAIQRGVRSRRVWQCVSSMGVSRAPLLGAPSL